MDVEPLGEYEAASLCKAEPNLYHREASGSKQNLEMAAAKGFDRLNAAALVMRRLKGSGLGKQDEKSQ